MSKIAKTKIQKMPAILFIPYNIVTKLSAVYLNDKTDDGYQCALLQRPMM